MCPNVEVLSCADNCLTSVGLKALRDFRNLKQLYLQGNFIGDEGVPEILGSKTLEYVNLSNNIIFQQTLPRDNHQVQLKMLNNPREDMQPPLPHILFRYNNLPLEWAQAKSAEYCMTFKHEIEKTALLMSKDTRDRML